MKATTTTEMVNTTTTTKENIATVMSKEIEQTSPILATTKESGKVKSSNAREIKFYSSIISNGL